MKSEDVYIQIKEELEEIESKNLYPIIDPNWIKLKANLNCIKAIDNNRYDEGQQAQIDNIKSFLSSMDKQFPLQSCIDVLNQFNKFVINRHKTKQRVTQSI